MDLLSDAVLETLPAWDAIIVLGYLSYEVDIGIAAVAAAGDQFLDSGVQQLCWSWIYDVVTFSDKAGWIPSPPQHELTRALSALLTCEQVEVLIRKLFRPYLQSCVRDVLATLEIRRRWVMKEGELKSAVRGFDHAMLTKLAPPLAWAR